MVHKVGSMLHTSLTSLYVLTVYNMNLSLVERIRRKFISRALLDMTIRALLSSIRLGRIMAQ